MLLFLFGFILEEKYFFILNQFMIFFYIFIRKDSHFLILILEFFLNNFSIFQLNSYILKLKPEQNFILKSLFLIWLSKNNILLIFNNSIIFFILNLFFLQINHYLFKFQSLFIILILLFYFLIYSTSNWNLTYL
jgi:hypothetical protein